jgi:hypothetical protein
MKWQPVSETAGVTPKKSAGFKKPALFLLIGLPPPAGRTA